MSFCVGDSITINRDIFVDRGVWRKGVMCIVTSVIRHGIYRIRRNDLDDKHSVIKQGYYADCEKLAYITEIEHYTGENNESNRSTN